MNCPCGSEVDFNNCCNPFLTFSVKPDTAEKLMRSRYAAFTKADINYLKKTLSPESRHDFSATETEKWAKNAKWKGLKILSTTKGQPEDFKGTVEFVATYEYEGESLDHHEVSEFKKDDQGQWYFVSGESHTHPEGEGHVHKPKTVVRETPKLGRNDPCYCGSGKKYKKCCGMNV